MITLNKLSDLNNSSSVSIVQTSDDGKASWDVHLTTSDLPPVFENSMRRMANLSIIDAKDVKSDALNVFFIPVILSAIVQKEGQSKLFYRQKIDNVGPLTPTLKLDAFIISDTLQLIEHPYLRIEFGVMSSSEDNRNDHNVEGQRLGKDQSTVVGSDLRERDHIDQGENANGGLDLARGEHARTDTETRTPA